MSKFTKEELETIRELAQGQANAASRCSSAMAQKSFRFPDGSEPSYGQVQEAFKAHDMAASIFKKAGDKLIDLSNRATWPGTQYCEVNSLT